MRQKKDKTVAWLFTKFPWLLKKWAKNSRINEYATSPWTNAPDEISDSRIALITTGGVHLKSQRAFDMIDPSGDSTYREIPSDTVASDLTITHNYYDHSDADKDINIIFPIDRLNELRRAGDIGSINYRHFSFMGHITQHHLEALIEKSAPQVAKALIADSVDVALLTPA